MKYEFYLKSLIMIILHCRLEEHQMDAHSTCEELKPKDCDWNDNVKKIASVLYQTNPEVNGLAFLFMQKLS